MPKTLEFLFDVGSPTTYLAHKRLPDVVARTGAEVVYVPVLLGGIFKATGNASPAMVPAKGVYMNADMGRFAKRFGVTLNMNPYFPINTLPMMRMIAGLVGDARFPKLVDALFDAMWRARKNMGDPAVAGEVLTAAGFDPAELLAISETPEAKDRLKANTEAAVARGVFGAPTFFVGDEMFFGQDRLDFVEAALGA
ncbi:2-hydroxychromene-2-carboxylate isomerase [Caulobacter mirabilis]|uniref:2-hydroxychromene-2-carboxylate isomerase n=1 Tax=Caulobacter mirabilis TaxID=69666 RepID=A0A2D2AYK2_9CAUL|nr:2-hydroxychromene-2-carboxylate isomerase [Caulobacter mirabilis]ATQ43096.1 disulfide bond formation protein DsbA [Caulobacter mirabilis]